jgi:hypothetical protein
MASIQREVLIHASADDAWAALRDWGALHERLAPGFVTDTQLDRTDRIVTFFNGSVVRERLITLDDETRRLVWSIIDGPYTHHNGVAQIFTDAAREDQVRFVWTADLLPDELADRTAEMMERGLGAMKETLERARVAPAP